MVEERSLRRSMTSLHRHNEHLKRPLDIPSQNKITHTSLISISFVSVSFVISFVQRVFVSKRKQPRLTPCPFCLSGFVNISPYTWI